MAQQIANSLALKSGPGALPAAVTSCTKYSSKRDRMFYHENNMYSVSQINSSPEVFLKFFPQRLRILKQNFTRLLYVHIYAKIQNFIQLSLNLTKLCHIKRNNPVNFHISQHI